MKIWTKEDMVNQFGYNSKLKKFDKLVECWNIIGDNYTSHPDYPTVYIIEDGAFDAATKFSRIHLSKAFWLYTLSQPYEFCRKGNINKLGTRDWIYSTFGPCTSDYKKRPMSTYDWENVLVQNIDDINKIITIKNIPNKYHFDCANNIMWSLKRAHEQSKWRVVQVAVKEEKPKPKSKLKATAKTTPTHRGVYGIYCNNELIYIGMTWKQGFEIRWNQHIENIKNGSQELHLYSLFRQGDQIVFEAIIDISEIKLSEGEITERDVKMMELALIREHKPRGNISGNTMQYHT